MGAHLCSNKLVLFLLPLLFIQLLFVPDRMNSIRDYNSTWVGVVCVHLSVIPSINMSPVLFKFHNGITTKRFEQCMGYERHRMRTWQREVTTLTTTGIVFSAQRDSSQAEYWQQQNQSKTEEPKTKSVKILVNCLRCTGAREYACTG